MALYANAGRILPPIPTPFVGGAIAPSLLAENIARWNQLPLDGYVVLGSNGEAPLLDDHERQAVIRAAYDAIPLERAMIVGAGRESTGATIRCVREAFDLGADAVLVGVPSYYKPAMTDDVLYEHYARVAEASPGPVLLYSVPVFTGLPVSADLFLRLLAHEKVVGIKDSAGDISGLRALLEHGRRAGRPVSVLVGSSRVLAPGMSEGAAGGVLAVGCVAPALCASVMKAAREGRAADAEADTRALSALAEAVTRRHGIAGLKAALDSIHFFGGDPRPPLRPAGPEARAEIAGLMRQIGLLT